MSWRRPGLRPHKLGFRAFSLECLSLQAKNQAEKLEGSLVELHRVRIAEQTLQQELLA